MSLFSTFLLFLRTPRLAEKRSGRPGYLYRQSGIIRFSVFSAITIQPQLFDAKSLRLAIQIANGEGLAARLEYLDANMPRRKLSAEERIAFSLKAFP